jgi:protein tyrosine/serine phosphatase
MNLKNKLTVTAVFFLILCLICNCVVEAERQSRPGHWAAPVQREGLPNLHKVSDALYRGAQPAKEGIDELKKLGIKTIVSFRRSKKDLKLIKGFDFKFVHIPVFTFFPKKRQFAQFLDLFADPANLPVFVHCKHGADRTGAAVALYRIKIQNWEIDEAINEMVNGGFNFHRIHSHLKNFIRKFVRDSVD